MPKRSGPRLLIRNSNYQGLQNNAMLRGCLSLRIIVRLDAKMNVTTAHGVKSLEYDNIDCRSFLVREI
jgi:hypothetical protein